MLTCETVLEIFKNYLSQDVSCEVLSTSRGYLVVDWESRKNDWVTTRLCQTPEQLRDTLRSHFEEYQGYLLTNGYKREVTSQEKLDIQRMSSVLIAQCEGIKNM